MAYLVRAYGKDSSGKEHLIFWAADGGGTRDKDKALAFLTKERAQEKVLVTRKALPTYFHVALEVV